MVSAIAANKAVATRFIEGFNTNDWESVRDVVAPEFVFHHPDGGTVAAGPEGMVAAWSAFKDAVPDAWHPIPIMIAEGDCVAVLLPTYGHFTGTDYHGIPATGEWLEYGMVNIVRLGEGKLVEAWFGMDSLAEKQQMGVAPLPPERIVSTPELAAIKNFKEHAKAADLDYDKLAAFGDVVVALGPPQHFEDTKLRAAVIYRVGDDKLELLRSLEFHTIPSYPGDLSADAGVSRAVVTQYFDDELMCHDVDALVSVVSPDILIHATGLPCEATYYGIDGVREWLCEQWRAFPDLTIEDDAMIAQGDMVAVRWTARGTSEGEFMLMPPTGKEVEFSGVSMYRVLNGAIAEIWETRNTLGLLRQLGLDADHH